MSLENAFLIPETPEASAPVVDFFVRDKGERENIVAWASGIIADMPHYPDDHILRAAKALAANAPARLASMDLLIDMMEART